MTINERLKEILKSKKQTQLELSEAIQVPKSTVNTWIKMGRDIPAQSIIPICGFLECSVEYLLTGQETKKAPAPGISENGRRMLEYFEDLSHDDQMLLIGEARGLQLAASKGKENAGSKSGEKAG